MKASDLFVRQLEEEGVEYVFGLPGEENLAFLESLRTSKIKCDHYAPRADSRVHGGYLWAFDR